ncbi:MAG: D-cysteine desulfhydrase family protein [Thermodesulfobacteriota bacterium]
MKMVKFEGIDRVTLSYLPTPLEYAPRLTQALGGPEIWIKRDDLTGLALGGNKLRKLDFFMAEAVRHNADCIVTMGPVQSNHVRLTAAASRACGLECHAVLLGDPPQLPKGNFLLDRMLGLNCIHVSGSMNQVPFDFVDQKIHETITHLKKEGKKPYLVPTGGIGPLGELGYCLAVEEMVEQTRRLGIPFEHLVVTVGSRGTIAGLLLGIARLNLKTKVTGISANIEGTCESFGIPGPDEMAAEAGRLIGLDLKAPMENYRIFYEYVGEGYGVPTESGIEAMKLAARTEALLLDPVYTGKAMAGLVDLIRRGYFTKKDTVIFIHTGGTPGIFLDLVQRFD